MLTLKKRDDDPKKALDFSTYTLRAATLIVSCGGWECHYFFLKLVNHQKKYVIFGIINISNISK